ncbi:hypothetical protein GDO81_026420 [Engystomops pustulosus]|uniref:Taste receptor type 2 n=1 Tax=Engystomops pustulosus TaxID=76066 RepID=A0AAV6YQX1_ENGPU|nr:hypothetical protein GDO81_026420 [Engystomops pustulosus]
MSTEIVKALDFYILAIDFVSLLMTFPGYMFIIVVNILDWMKNKRLDISDQLICGLGLLSLIHRITQVSVVCIILIYGLNEITYFTWISMHLMHYSINLCTLLFSTWLSIHFCLKIVNINHNLYINIQNWFPQMFPWIHFLSVLTSLLISGPAAQDVSGIISNSIIFLNISSSPLKIFLSSKLYYVFSAIFFLIFVIMVLVTIVSLYRHIKLMQNNTNHFRAETIEVPVNAVKTLIFLICLNLLHFILPIVTMFVRNHLQLVVLIFAILHSLDLPILIRGSTKLKKKLNELWLYLISLAS